MGVGLSQGVILEMTFTFTVPDGLKSSLDLRPELLLPGQSYVPVRPDGEVVFPWLLSLLPECAVPVLVFSRAESEMVHSEIHKKSTPFPCSYDLMEK